MAWACSISPSVMPDASSGLMTSLCHQAVSVSLIRRRLSPQTRSHRSMTIGPKPICQLQLDHWHDRQLVVVDGVLRPWLGEAEGLADHHQELQGDAGAGAQLGEGRAAEPGEPVERGRIQVGERERSVPDGGSHSLQRHAGPLKVLHPPRPEHVTGRERVCRIWGQDAELDQPVDVVGVDPGPLGDLLPGVSAHASASIASCRRAGVAYSPARTRASSQRVGADAGDDGAVHAPISQEPGTGFDPANSPMLGVLARVGEGVEDQGSAAALVGVVLVDHGA